MTFQPGDKVWANVVTHALEPAHWLRAKVVTDLHSPDTYLIRYRPGVLTAVSSDRLVPRKGFWR